MPRPFVWATGVENAVMPDLGVDQLAWTRHRDRWREDLELARDAGATHLRYGVPWPDIHTAPGTFDWTWCDAAVDHLNALRVEPIWDLVHFGTPAWLTGGMRDPAFPEALAAYCGAFAARYAGVLTKLTPFNEPYIAATFRGGIGAWPPHEVGRAGFVRSLMPIVEALHRANRAIRAANPRAELWLNDGADRFTAATAELEDEARILTLERYAALDLLEGRAPRGSEMYEHLTHFGFPGETLERYAHDPAPVDVIGLDYYPGTEHRIDRRRGPRRMADWGRREYAMQADPRPLGLAATARAYWERYGRPLYVAETSAETLRREWLAWSTAECARARADGVPVIGYTWWPLFDHVDWNSGLTRHVGYVSPSGLYHLTPTVADRQESDLVAAFRALAGRGDPVDDAPREMPWAIPLTADDEMPAASLGEGHVLGKGGEERG